MRFRSTLSIAIALTLQACATTSTGRSPAASPTPLQVLACPPLAPLVGDSFGETTQKLIEVATKYRECKAAHGHKD